MTSPLRVCQWAVAGSVLVCALGATADLEIVSSMTFESQGRRYVQPCVRNNTREPRQAHFKIGSRAVRWTFHPLPVPAGQTVCFALDAPPIAPGVANEIHVE
jgi:hypothetical protein